MNLHSGELLCYKCERWGVLSYSKFDSKQELIVGTKGSWSIATTMKNKNQPMKHRDQHPIWRY